MLLPACSSAENEIQATNNFVKGSALPELRSSILKEILLQLPALIGEVINNNYSLCTPTVAATNATFTETTEKDIASLKLFQKDTCAKFEGYQTQVQAWIEAVKRVKKKVDTLEKQIEKHVKEMQRIEKTINNKTKDYSKAEKKVKEILNQYESKNAEINKHLEDFKTFDKQKVLDIDESQNFVSNKYDNLVKDLDEVKKRLNKNITKTHNNSKYSRLDCLVFDGVPTCLDANGEENCKEMIINICKELHLWLPEMAISTAHRMYQHPDKKGPPPIIVKFILRDHRNDVFSLRKQIKDKTHWYSYGIQRLFINEHLSPETRKLLYKAKQFTRQMPVIEGKIYVWTFKGDVYLRKDMVGAQKIKILSEDDLLKLMEGKMSFDKPTPPAEEQPASELSKSTENTTNAHRNDNDNIAISITQRD